MPLPLPTKYLKIAGLLALFAAGWFANGWRLGEIMAEKDAKLAEAAQKQAMAALSIERLAAQRSAALGAQAAAEQRAVRAKGKVIIKKVIEYVQDPNTGKCELPDAWVQTHNEATGATVPSTASAASASAAAASRAATDRDALVAVTENYNRCRENIVQLRGLIDWAKSLQRSQ